MQGNYIKNPEINKIKIAFTDKPMTAYGGFSLLAGFFEKIKFREHIEEIFAIKETSPNGTGVYAKVISYALIIFAGGERFSHVLYLGGQKILSELFNVKRLIKAGTSLTRMFNRISKISESNIISYRIWKYLDNIITWEQIREDWINFDSTVLERYGEQEGVERGYNPRKKGRGSHCPILAFLNLSKYVVNIWNRPGNITSWNNIYEFFQIAYNRVKNRIKILGVVCDSGFYEKRFIELLEEKKLIYIITARLYHTLQRKIIRIEDWHQIDQGIAISEFYFAHKDWIRERRYIVVRQEIESRPKAMGKQLHFSFINEQEEKSYRYSIRITNSQADAYDVWNQCKPRANDENTIKELKEDFALGGFCLKKFFATEAAMLIRVLIYNLFVLFRSVVMYSKEKTQRLKTLRYKFFVVPAQLGSHGRDKILRLSMYSNNLKSKMKILYHRISQYIAFDIPNCNAFEKAF